MLFDVLTYVYMYMCVYIYIYDYVMCLYIPV